VFRKSPHAVSRAPGRVNLMGDHVDYLGGLVLPAGIDLETAVAFAGRSDGIVRAVSESTGEEVCFGFDDISPAGPMPGWGRYPAGTSWALVVDGLHSGGMDAYIASDIPPGAGLSSSAALEAAFAAALVRSSGCADERNWRPGRIAACCTRGENEYAGVPCGVMDQLVACLAVEGHALMIDCSDLSISAVPVPAEWALVVCDSGVRHDLADRRYAGRREEAAAAMAVLAAAGLTRRGGTTLRGFAAEAPEVGRAFQGPAAGGEQAILARRARHFTSENRRVPAAADALRSVDGELMREVMAESHASLRDDCEVSCSALDSLVSAASGIDGCIGSRMTGGGFGGSTVSIVRMDALPGFMDVMSGVCPGGVRVVRPSGAFSIEEV
jgi:galactokinase